jgi:hypothetical protein
VLPLLRRVDHHHQPAVRGVPRLAPDGVEQQAHELAGLREAAGLHDDEVEAGGRGRQLGQQAREAVGVGGAAQAPVGERGHGTGLPGDEHRVDPDRPEVVDDDADPDTVGAAQQVVDQRRLAGPEVSGDEHHGDATRHADHPDTGPTGPELRSERGVRAPRSREPRVRSGRARG